ncbi:MAG: leucyl aminopeptidase [Pseudomonadota bacterium]
MEFNIAFSATADDLEGLTILLCAEERALSGEAAAIVPEALFNRAADATKFSGKSLSTLDLIAPEGVASDRLMIIGLGDTTKMLEADWLKLGGKIGGAIVSSGLERATILLKRPDDQSMSIEQIMNVVSGMKLRSYKFDRYKTKKKDKDEDNEETKVCDVFVAVEDPAAATETWEHESGVIDGAILARDLVNEPPNVLGPVEFADHAKALEKLGVEVEILDEAEMSDLGMRAFLGVGQGSVRPPRLAVMKWMGGAKDADTLAFIGKGVVFDTGGISLKPGAGMEDMKGDMGGAAAVIGLMHALAARKAKANVVGLLGLVENMPDGNAQRPGDIVTTMSGQTVEIINTDAEGRLVLCDVLTYTSREFSPKFMIDLATLTGAIIVALGHHKAGLYCNDDDLALQIAGAGRATGEEVWRMPLGPEYDKMIDSKFADMKNVGGRMAGSVTAAQFLKRFVGDTSWAHLDIAGTAMGSPQTEVNKSWASGYGVRLLDRLVRDNYE